MKKIRDISESPESTNPHIVEDDWKDRPEGKYQGYLVTRFIKSHLKND